jgi:hypothetical protein
MKRIKKSDNAIKTALKAAHGNVSAAARALGMDRTSVWRRMQGNAVMTAIVNDARESMADNAESALGLATLRGEAWAVCFTLKCLGKDRGYIERGEVSHDVKLVVSHSAEDLTDEQLAAIASRAVASRGSQRLIGPADGPQEPD